MSHAAWHMLQGTGLLLHVIGALAPVGHHGCELRALPAAMQEVGRQVLRWVR